MYIYISRGVFTYFENVNIPKLICSHVLTSQNYSFTCQKAYVVLRFGKQHEAVGELFDVFCWLPCLTQGVVSYLYHE